MYVIGATHTWRRYGTPPCGPTACQKSAKRVSSFPRTPIAGRSAGSHFVAAQPLHDVGEPAGLAELTVADDVHPGVNLLANDLRHRRAQHGGARRFVRVRLEREHLGRSDQAACKSRQNAVAAALHVWRSLSISADLLLGRRRASGPSGGIIRRAARGALGLQRADVALRLQHHSILTWRRAVTRRARSRPWWFLGSITRNP